MPRRLTLASALLPVAAALSLAGVAQAEDLEVNKRGDHVPGACTNADCTLREAVIAANGQPGDDRVELPSRKPYELTRKLGLGPGEADEGDLDIDSGLGNLITLVHPGSGRAKIDASGADDRVIEVVGVATLRKLVLRDGRAQSTGEAGGALFVDGNATLVRSRVKGSRAPDVGGGIFVTDGDLELHRSAVRRNGAGGEGGGIFVNDDATFRLEDSTVARNEASEGGGVFSTSDAGLNVILASTVAGNEVEQEGGGIWNGGPLFVGNSTVADNTAAGSGGGLYAAPDSLAELEFVTIARNRADADDLGPHGGGGVFADGGDDVVSSLGSLFARNRATGGGFEDCDAPAPVGIVSLGDNLVTTEQDCPFFDHAGDVTDDEPEIGVLADNGGPTQTVKLKQGSPAVDATANGPELDQRGVERDALPDIGAFERK